MLEMQMQMRTPAEEREQTDNNKKFKNKLYKLVEDGVVLTWGSLQSTYESIVAKAQEPQTIEKKVVSPEIQAKLLAGIELTQEELQSLR
jgi:hypothetical protein